MIPYQNLGYPGLQSTPYNVPSVPMYQPQTGQTQQLTRVTGLDGAKAYQMPPNSTAALFDNNEDILYIKMTDGAGFPTVRVFRFEEVAQKTQSAASPEYITRKEMVDYVEHAIHPAAETADLGSNNSEG